ncbi:toluene hydroxylase [Acidimicrobiaceae bacterium USS-CC1]|uniref:propane 2-monooxygenase n=1 Tax=Acidiferrimicrobium australe TaxID=2664430 RepID=A0ABW9QPM4_9ACTN|nr:toluene hydroxylase [Acidiferrimicrobium australe]
MATTVQGKTVQDKKEHASAPRPEFTNAEAGALAFPSSTSREYNYYKPSRLRRTVYEDVTVEVQPDPERYLSQGWLYAFADGRAGYPQEWTALRSGNWHAFRDPNEEWERTIYVHNARVVHQISQSIETARLNKAFRRWDPSWVRQVEGHVGAWAHAEHGLGMHVFVPAQRDAPTNMHNNAISVNAMHKLRFAQDLILYNLTLSEEFDGFDGQRHQRVWMEDPSWQGVREAVERITTIRDWAEAVFVVNFVFEPLVGALFRSRFIMQVAAPHGDFTTPTVVGAGEVDYARDLRYSRDIFALLVNDAEHATHNHSVMQGWLEQWTPSSVQAARRLQPLWSQPNQRLVRFEDSFAGALEQFHTQVRELGLESPEEARA